MKAIDEHNAERRRAYEDESNPRHPTGIKCPQCDGELYTVDNAVLTSIPPRRHVQCDKCGHITTVIA